MSDIQRTMEWHLKRLGKPTASRFGDIKPGRGHKWSDKTASYMRELLVERLTGQWTEAYGNAIEWGVMYEDEARDAYQARTGVTVDRVDFLELDDIGGSPDGLIGDDGCLEIKCPYNSGNHIDYIMGGCGDHLPQMMGIMYLAGRQWCDFISYDPRFPEEYRLYIERVTYDPAAVAEMIARVHDFAADLDELEFRVKTKCVMNEGRN